jgi:DNA-binding response OmpR family regulator
MKRVLVVDDNLDILHLVQIILKNNGFEVLVSPKGDDVLAHTENFSPQVILLDVFLSGHDGREICRALKNNPKTKNIPVIMFSAHTKKEDIIRDCNADDFIAKPFELNELIQKVNYRIITQTSNN